MKDRGQFTGVQEYTIPEPGRLSVPELKAVVFGQLLNPSYRKITITYFTPDEHGKMEAVWTSNEVRGRLRTEPDLMGDILIEIQQKAASIKIGSSRPSYRRFDPLALPHLNVMPSKRLS